MTITDMEKLFINELSPLYNVPEAAAISRISIGFSLRISRSQYLAMRQEEMSKGNADQLYKILDELKRGIPVQYVLGETEFYGLVFKVDPTVLIPRPETEELVDWIIKDIRMSDSHGAVKILDIGTGSGCIPVALKKILPFADVSAMDVSPEALNTARGNARMNQTDINFIQDNILDPAAAQTVYSVIVSNPPYVTLNEKPEMHTNVTDHEPHLALFVPDEDPLIFYRAIANYSLRHLVPNGYLYLEINENLGRETVELVLDKGFIDVELKQDLSGRDRMIRARKPPISSSGDNG